jgi:hypothetical protein
LKDENGKRPVYAHHPQLQDDPHFRDYVLFYEYFHGDTGRGVGASHQTGWTALAVRCVEERGRMRHGEHSHAAGHGQAEGPVHAHAQGRG